MPRLSVILIRTALLYLAAGFTVGGLLLFNKGVPFSPMVWRLLPMHIEFVLVGWTIQLVVGVAFWTFPRFARGPTRGDERLVWVAYSLLNGGVLSAALSLWLTGPMGLPIGRIAELIAVALFAFQLWPRVKPLGA